MAGFGNTPLGPKGFPSKNLSDDFVAVAGASPEKSKELGAPDVFVSPEKSYSIYSP
jgi:hypothetical protein